MPLRLPIGELRFLYVGTERDLAFYIDVLGATLRWRFQAFEADVAAVALGDGPLVVLAEHRPTAHSEPALREERTVLTGAGEQLL